MKVHFVSPPSDGLLSLLGRFQARGDVVSHSDQVPRVADLYIFCTGHDAIRHLAHGLVVADLRHETQLEAAGWVSYADLCLVGTTDDQLALNETHDCEPERVFVAPDDDYVLDLIDKALQDTLPPAAAAKRQKALADQQSQSESATLPDLPQIAALTARLKVVEHQADVMQRDYRVHSKAPLIGPLVAWVRRNLTSHLREPYLDPTLERQVALNRDLLKVLQEMRDMLANLELRLARLEDQNQDDR